MDICHWPVLSGKNCVNFTSNIMFNKIFLYPTGTGSDITGPLFICIWNAMELSTIYLSTEYFHRVLVFFLYTCLALVTVLVTLTPYLWLTLITSTVRR